MFLQAKDIIIIKSPPAPPLPRMPPPPGPHASVTSTQTPPVPMSISFLPICNGQEPKLRMSIFQVAGTARAGQSNGGEGRSAKKAPMSISTYFKKGESARQTGAPDSTVIPGKKRVSAAKRVSGSQSLRSFRASASECLPISPSSLLLSAQASALHIPAGQTSPPEGGRDTGRGCTNSQKSSI